MKPLHGTAVAIGGRGVLLLGPSGSGKSDLALRLIDRGGVLIADDYVEAELRAGAVYCSPPAAIAGRLEVRGVGIAVLPFVTDVRLALAVLLGDAPERLPPREFRNMAGIDVPQITVRAFEASAPMKVELALSGTLTALD